MLRPVNLDYLAPKISILLNIIRMKNQRSNLDTFPRDFSLSPSIHKCAMRRPSSPSIYLRVKTLDQHNLLWGLLPKIIPTMALIGPNGKSLPDPIRINQLHGQKVVFGHRRSIGDSKRVFADGLDGTPDVDDLVAAFEEAVSVGGEVVLDALGAGFVGLVDVDALNGAAEGLGSVGWVSEALVGGLAADDVVKDEDLGGAGAEENDVGMKLELLILLEDCSIEGLENIGGKHLTKGAYADFRISSTSG